jgi:alpha-glucosidase (family GH31 glycosyl hydrolase)
MINLIKEFLDNISKHCSKSFLTIIIIITGTIACFLSIHIAESYSEEIKKINIELKTKLVSSDIKPLIQLQTEANKKMLEEQKESNKQMLDEQKEYNEKMLNLQKEFYEQKLNKLEEDFKDLKDSNDYIVKQFLSKSFNL